MVESLRSEEVVDEASDFGHLKPGTRLGRYELLVPVARGGMARVWAARLIGQRGFQKLVAIKTILPHLASETEFERMFLDEARIASGVHHPNVCEIYELGDESRTLYMVMEWVGGDSFARVLRPTGRNEAIDPRVVARVVADACAGVHAAHEIASEDGRPLNVVHRDLSPHNILLTAEGFAKVCDFGVAKALGQLHEATSAGTLKGKVAYMSPEQVTASPVDRRSDVFSLGVVLYEATTGMRPFRGDGEAQVMHALLKGEFDPPSTLLRHFPADLERIITRALAPQPILRFPTAERMRFALEEFLAKGPLVTQSNVAQVVRARIGEALDKRKERIRLASTKGDTGAAPAGDASGAAMTPSNQDANANRSGVKQAPTPGPPAVTPAPPHAGLSETLPQAPPQFEPQFGVFAEPGPAGAPPPLTQTVAMPTAPVQPPYGFPPSVGPQPAPGFPRAPSPSAPSSGGAYGAPLHEAVPPAPAPAPGAYVLAAAVGVLVAVVIGGGAYWAWHRKHAEPPLLIAQPATPTPSSQVAPAAAQILVRVTPPEATLSVDGVELGSGARAVTRPARGGSAMVVARAKGFEDATVLVDWLTTSPLEIALKPASPPTIELGDNAPAPRAGGAPEPPPADTAAPAPPANGGAGAKPKRALSQSPALPANPY
jgi:serine/threonine-protein kinase